MNKIHLFFLTLLYSQTILFSQFVDLVMAGNFVFLTSSGTINYTGASTKTVDIRTDFGTLSMVGAKVIVTENSQKFRNCTRKKYLLITYNQIMFIPVSNKLHPPIVVENELSIPDDYEIGGAPSLIGDIILV
jgi:hypothetical protein